MKLLKSVAKVFLALITLSAAIIVTLKLPEAHDLVLRYYVNSKVFMIKDSPTSGGGTGFAIKAASGESFILTNDHVCGVSSDGKTVLVVGKDNVNMRRRIIAHDGYSDLCLIEGVPGVTGLEVAKYMPYVGEIIRVIGHPRLMPLHISAGELTGTSTVTVAMGPMSLINPETGKEEPIPNGIPAEQCSLPKNRQIWQDVDVLFFVLRVKMCVVQVDNAYLTSVTIFPGNSGSPVVNWLGQVQGVAFASDSTNWGVMVSLHDVNSFLKNF